MRRQFRAWIIVAHQAHALITTRGSLAVDKQRWVNEILHLREGVKHCFTIGLEIAWPTPWPPALEIIDLHLQGFDVAAIAKKVDYSKFTVERALKTGGMHPTSGPHCFRHAGRVFSIEEALQEMPIPCGPGCICSWRPLFTSDKKSCKGGVHSR